MTNMDISTLGSAWKCARVPIIGDGARRNTETPMAETPSPFKGSGIEA
jgi:hypothetical protein